MGICELFPLSLFLQHLIVHTEEIVSILVFSLELIEQLILFQFECLQLSLILLFTNSMLMQNLGFGLVQCKFVFQILHRQLLSFDQFANLWVSKLGSFVVEIGVS